MNDIVIASDPNQPPLIFAEDGQIYDLVELGEKARNASQLGSKASKELKEYVNKSFIQRILSDKKIKLATLDAIDAIQDMAIVAIQLSDINQQQSSVLRNRQKAFSKENNELLKELLDRSEYIEQVNASVDQRIKDIELQLRSAGNNKDLDGIKQLILEKHKEEKESRVYSINNAYAKIEAFNKKITEEFSKRDSDFIKERTLISQSIKRSSKDGVERIANLKSKVHTYLAFIVVFMVFLNIGGLFFISKKIMASPAPVECIESSVCLIKWLAGMQSR